MPLTITAVDPAKGPISGGLHVTIRGTAFAPAGLQVFVDDQPAPVTYIAPTELRVVMPAHDNGFAELRVSHHGRSAAAEFLYEPPRLDEIAIGSVTTIAGIGRYAAKGGAARSAPFDPTDIAIDADGSVIVVERDRSVVRIVSPQGTTAVLAGRGFPPTPSESAAGMIGDGGPATAAAVGGQGIALGPDGHVYLATLFQHRIRKVDRGTGVITTVAGSGPLSFFGAFAGDGGPATAARLDQPNQVAFDGSGNLYILDAFNYRIRKVSRDGVIDTVAGSGVRGFAGDGGPATLAAIDIGPNGDTGVLKVSPDGTIFLGDTDNRRIRKIDPVTGLITTILGGGTRTEDGAPATQLQTAVWGIALAPDGIYFSDQTRIRKIRSDGTVSTLFGGPVPGFSPDGASAGPLAGTGPLALDLPRNRLVFTERSTNRVRAIDLGTGILSTIAGIGPATFGENGPAIAAELDAIDGDARPLGITANDELLIGGYRRLRLLESSGVLRTIAGGGIVPSGPPPTPRPALGIPLDVRGIAVAETRDVYVTDAFSVGRISPDGTYRRIAGGRYGYAGDNGPAAAAALDNPAGIAVDRQGNLFIADAWNHCIRRIDAATGVITTFAGKSPPHLPNVLIQNPSSGDGGLAVDAQASFPTSVAIDAAGNVYFAEPAAIRRVDAAGRIETAVPRTRCSPRVVAADAAGRIYAYCFNGEIVRIDGPDQISTIARTSGRFGFAGDGGDASNAETRDVSGLAIDRQGNVYLHDAGNRRVRVIRGVAR